MTILFFKPIPKVTVWGVNHVKNYFGYADFPDHVGQAWVFSGQPTEANGCLTPPYKGKNLHELWRDHQELFGYQTGEFPLIISLVAPDDDLSIQVHPDEGEAKKIGFSMGKNEAWYFIQPPTTGKIVYGHHAQNPEEMEIYIQNQHWMELIDYLPVKKEDFVYLPAGLLHALQKGSIVYEIQQATDVTYRFFDYHRKDENNQERELHLEQALECVTYDKIKNDHLASTNGGRTTYIDNDSFTVIKLEIAGQFVFKDEDYQLATVIHGRGEVNSISVQVGSNFLIPVQTEAVFNGKMVVMMTTKKSVYHE